MPKEFADEFTYTSININKNYAGRLHRDGNNVGPSFIKAFGEFTGGNLNYFASDDKKKPLEEFNDKDKTSIDIRSNLLLFDGNRGHYVSEFKGERYSLVFFSLRTWNKVPAEDRKAAKEVGIPLPTAQSMAHANTQLSKAGYRVWPLATEGVTPSKKRGSPLKVSTPAKRVAAAARPSGTSTGKASPAKATPTKAQGVKRAAPAQQQVQAKKPRGRPPKQ